MRERNPGQTLVYSLFLSAPIAVVIRAIFEKFGQHTCSLLVQSEFIQNKSISIDDLATVCLHYVNKAADSIFIVIWIVCIGFLFFIYEAFIFSANETTWPPRR